MNPRKEKYLIGLHHQLLKGIMITAALLYFPMDSLVGILKISINIQIRLSQSRGGISSFKFYDPLPVWPFPELSPGFQKHFLYLWQIINGSLLILSKPSGC